MPVKRHVTSGTKKLVAGRQRYMCAATVPGYVCPLSGTPFDEAGYEVDHILPLSDGGTNEASNLQALCLMCHRVKSNRASVGKSKKTASPKKKKEGFVYTGPTLSDSDSDSPMENEHPVWTKERLALYQKSLPAKKEGEIAYWPDDAAKRPLKIKWKAGSDSLKFGLWRQQNGYSQFPDAELNYIRQR